MQRLIAFAAALVLSAFLSALAVNAGPVCYVGASVGGGATVVKGNDTIEKVSLGDSNLIVAPEAGCDFRWDALTIGALVRYDFSNFKEQGIESSGQFIAAARVGFNINPSTLAYGLAGVAFDRIDVQNIKSQTLNSWLVGAGLEIDLGLKGTPLSVFAEYNFIRYETFRFSTGELSAAIRPDDHVARVGLRLALGK